MFITEPGKSGSDAGHGGEPVPPSDRPAPLPFPVRFQPESHTSARPAEAAKAYSGPGPLALYLHVPFCVTRCYFCDFVTVVGKHVTPERIERYAAALHTELDASAEKAEFARPFATAQLGGGTPTMLDPDALARLLDAVRSRLAPDGAEIVVEGFPTSVDREKLAVLRGRGDVKFNMGVQTFDDGVLEAIGRSHERDDAIRAITEAKSEGLPSVGIDLIYGLPDGGLDVVRSDVEMAVGFGVDHVALYPLWVYPQTRLNSLIKVGERSGGAYAERSRQLALADALLREAGFTRYTAFHYAKDPGHHHGYGLWQMRGRDWLGVGQGAVSQLDGTVYENDRGYTGYLRRAEAAVETAASAERLGLRAEMVRHVSYGIREAVYDTSGFERRFGTPFRSAFGPAADWAVSEGLVDEGPDGVSLTHDGILRLGDLERVLAETPAGSPGPRGGGHDRVGT